MTRWIFTLLTLYASAALGGTTFESTLQGQEWRSGARWIRFEKGRWSAGVDGGGRVRWYMFLWHDRWLYETLPGGKIESGPTVASDGTLTMQGLFSARENSAPMHYAYRITPSAEGVDVHCELQKSGPLKLSNGVWLHVEADRKTLRPTQRLWLEPSAHGTLVSTLHGMAKNLHIEVGARLAVRLGGGGRLHEVDTESAQHALYRFRLLAGDFEPDAKVAVDYQVRFGDLPAVLPGTIGPQQQPLAIRAAKANAQRVPLYEKLELDVDLSATYQNPFDPDEVRLDAEFTGPAGKTTVVPGFFMVDYGREVLGDAELLTPQNSGRWKVRFTPREVGRYAWRLRLADRSGKIAGGAGQFEALPAQTPGFVRRSPVDPHYLAFDSGRGFYPIGHNLPIYHASGQLGDAAMRRFAAAKENYNRWWMSASGFGIEWAQQLGWYRQDTASRLDLSLDVARELGLYYMLCMDTHQDFREAGWEKNPFNARNGGPCAAPTEWFTNPVARNYYKKRLRYTVARWGYSPNILCWEFGNEMEGWAKSPDEVKLPWHKEMADHLRAIDPFGHLITTSFWTNTGPEEYWKLDNIDIVQTHLYTNNDGGVAETVRDCCLHQWEKFPKPHIFGEFGIRSGAGTPQKDPQGWAIHNGLWAGLMSLAAGGPMPWWHEDYLDKLDLYFHFTALAQFTADLPLGSARWTAAQIEPPEYTDRKRPAKLRDVTVEPRGSGWTPPAGNEFRVSPDGSVSNVGKLAMLLHGDGHRDLRNPPTFVVDYPQPGRFVVRVGRVSHSGRLCVWIDDRHVLDRQLPCAEGLGKESVYQPRWKLWETTYDEDFAVDVPAGAHRIRVDNRGKDWVIVGRYVFTHCKVLDRPNVNAWGIATDGQAALWLQNRDSTWFNHAGGGPIESVDPFQLRVSGLKDGRYQVEWWETWKGRIERNTMVESRGGRLTIDVPTLATDVALKLRPAK